MEFEKADMVTLADNVIETRVTMASSTGAVQKKYSRSKGSSTERYNTIATQTVGHVFLGKQGEVIVTTNYTLVKLVINNEAMQRLTDCGSDVNQFTDRITTSLARLDWNGERILEKAMTSIRFTLTNDVMPQLIQEVADILKTESKHHKVQDLAQHLLEKHMTRLFGMDIGSLSFILEHCSVDDARATLKSRERQEELQRVFFSFLPDYWVTLFAKMHVTTYTLTLDDRQQDFSFRDPDSVSFVASLHPVERPSFQNPRSYVCSSTIDPIDDSDIDPCISPRKAFAGGKKSACKARTAEKPRAVSCLTKTTEEPEASTSYGSSKQVQEEGSAVDPQTKDTPQRGWASRVTRDERAKRKQVMKSKKACCIM